MSEKTFPNVDMPIDYLHDIIKAQKQFQEINGYDPRLHNVASAIMAEGGELWAIVGGKWWKMYEEQIGRWGKLTPEKAIEEVKKIEVLNTSKAKEEAIDIFHFLLCAFISLGMDSKEIYEEYAKKMGINKKRQETGY